jgi:kumamolisin
MLISGSISAALLVAAAGCSRLDSTSADPDFRVTSALTGGGLSSANLQLETLTNTCGANQVQSFFQISNLGTTSVKLSDLAIKVWVDDTSGSNVVPAINTGGCVVGPGNPSCMHNVSGVTAQAAAFSPACGPDATHQANWELSFTTSDSTLLAPGQSWNNLQTALHLANYANFTPGTAKWFSGCLPGTQYAADPHFALYYQGILIFSSGVSAPICRAPHGSQQLSGHITPTISGAPFVRPVPPSLPLTMAIGLPGTNPQGRQTQVQNVSDPTSPLYRSYLTPAVFASTYGAPLGNYQTVTAWATSKGLTVKTFPNQLLLSISGTAAQIEQALYLNLNFYARPDGTVFYAPDREPSLDEVAPVTHISHLDDFFVPAPAVVGGGTGVNGSFEGTDYRNAYFPSCAANVTGAGQRIGLDAIDGFSLADLQGYAQLGVGGVTIPPISTVIVDANQFQTCQPVIPECPDGTFCRADPSCPRGLNCCPTTVGSTQETDCSPACPANSGCNVTGSPCPSLPTSGGTLEASVDIEMAMSMAPGIDEIVVFEGGVANTVLAAMATTSPLCNQLSTSVFLGPVDVNTQPILDELALQGQTLFEASGDVGRRSDPLGLWDQPGVITVGGTDLTTTPATVNAPLMYSSEAAWAGSSGWIADGGTFGTASSTPIPPFQRGISMSTNQGSTTFRNVPDVALPGDDVVVFSGGQSGAIGGTSFASPLWAGVMALINQQSALASLEPVGFFNPVLYAIGKSTSYGDCFNDVQTGITNDGQTGNASFPAVKGYDLATGWGTPTCGLIYQLATFSPVNTVPTTTLHVTGSIVLSLTDASGNQTTTTTPVDSKVAFSVRIRINGFEVNVARSGVVADVGGTFQLAANSVDLVDVNEGFHLGQSGFVGPSGRMIPAHTSITETNSVSVNLGTATTGQAFSKAAMSWTLTLASSQP